MVNLPPLTSKTQSFDLIVHFFLCCNFQHALCHVPKFPSFSSSRVPFKWKTSFYQFPSFLDSNLLQRLWCQIHEFILIYNDFERFLLNHYWDKNDLPDTGHRAGIVVIALQINNEFVRKCSCCHSIKLTNRLKSQHPFMSIRKLFN